MTMRLAVIADSFPPHRTSAAVQIRDISSTLAKLGHAPTVITPDPSLSGSWTLEEAGGVEVLRLRSVTVKDVSYARRTPAESVAPFLMAGRYRRSPLAQMRWDGIVWYSPSIFLGPIVKLLKDASSCPSYLILRDIFPEWAVDMGLLGRGLPYWLFKLVENYQYKQADVIGVQSHGNLKYFADRSVSARIEVLQNWIAPSEIGACRIRLSASPLANMKIFVYAGNMGVAQGVEIFVELAARLRDQNVGFLFVGRGSETARLQAIASQSDLSNALFYDEIPPDEIPGLYAQCHVGLVALDPRHKTHNVPGKFLTYMAFGLPVLASVNPGNDLIEIIERHHVGRASSDSCPSILCANALAILNDLNTDQEIHSRCRKLAAESFSAEAAAQQVLRALETHRNCVP